MFEVNKKQKSNLIKENNFKLYQTKQIYNLLWVWGIYLTCHLQTPCWLHFFSSMELINEPVSIDCGHSACKICLEELIRKSTHPTKCPSCRNFLKPGPLNVNIAIRAAISGINVRCTNAGCTWIGKQGEKVRHRDTCPKMLMPCPNDCTVQFCREEEGQHLAACLYEKVHCASCKAGVPRLYMDIHLQNCPDALWNCPLQCGEHLPRFAGLMKLN